MFLVVFYYNDVLVTSDYLFNENITVLAKWEAKSTHISLFVDDEPFKSIDAIFNQEISEVDVPFKEGYSFLGYFDSNDKQYYDSDGASLCLWDKEDEYCSLFARFEENVLLGETVPNFVHTVTVDLNGGTIDDQYVPNDWTNIGNNKYTKEFSESMPYYNAISEWYSKSMANYVIKEGQILNDYDYDGFFWTDDGDIYVTALYEDTYSLTIEFDETYSGDTITTKSNITKKYNYTCINLGSVITDDSGPSLDGSREIAEIVPGDGKGIAYFTVNGQKYNSGDSVYLYELGSFENINIVVYVADDYGVRIGNYLVNSLNFDDVLEGDYYYDGKISYDYSNKILSINGAESSETYIQPLMGITSSHDLTIETTGYVSVSVSSTNVPQNGLYGLFSTGTLTINADDDGLFNVESKIQYGVYEELNSAVYVDKLVINSGVVNFKGYSYGILVNELVINSANSPIVSSSASTRYAIKAENSIALNGASVLCADSEYVEGTTKSLFQLAASPVQINFDNSIVDYHLIVGNVNVTSLNCNDIVDGYNSYGTYDPDTKTLSLLADVSISSPGYCIFSKDDLIIKLNGNVYLTSICDFNSTGNSYGVYCEKNLTLSGDKDKIFRVDYKPWENQNYYVNVGIFADGVININTSVYSEVGDFKYTDDEKFKISCGIWGRQGINIEGSEGNVLSIETYGTPIPCGDYNSYGILAGDGYPKLDAPINIKYANVNSRVDNGVQNGVSSFYGLYAFGDMNIENSTVVPKVYQAKDTTTSIYCGGNMSIKNSDIEIEYPSFWNEGAIVNGIDSEGTLTIDSSTVNFYNPNYAEPLKKISAIKAYDTLTIKGDSTVVNVKVLETKSGDSIGINAKRKLEILGGNITAISSKSVGNSYAIFAGNDSFEGSHSFKNCTINVIADVSQDADSVGIKTKNGDVLIDSANISASGKKSAIFVNGVLSVDQTNPDNKTIITGDVSEGSKSIASKNVIALNEASVSETDTVYDPTSTDGFIQSGENPVKIYFKEVAVISGASLVYPQGKTSYTYGDAVSYTGTIKATYDDKELTDIDQEDYTYTYYKKDASSKYVKIDGVAKYAGDYKLVVSLDNPDYKGTQEIEFTIGKKDLTIGFDHLVREYTGDAFSPELVISGLVYGDTYSYLNSNPTYTYKEKGVSIFEKPVNVGEYEITAVLASGNISIVDSSTNDVISNYNITSLPGTYTSEFYISEVKAADGNIYSSSDGENIKVNSISLSAISKSGANKIGLKNDDVKNALANGVDILFYSKLGEVSNNDVFSSLNIDDTNSIMLSVNFYYVINGTEEQIVDLNGCNARITLSISKTDASIIIGNNKDYFVFRKHGDNFDKLPCSCTEEGDYYYFTFESDKFSDFAIISQDKPYSPEHVYVVPNTAAY